MKYNVGDYVKFSYEDIIDEFNGIGRIVEINSGMLNNGYLIELPNEYHGQGHRGNGLSLGTYDEYNYWFITDKHIWGTIDTKEDDSVSKKVEVVKGANILVQNVYKAVTNVKDGTVRFDPLKIVNVCFVKFDGNDKVYMFNNPTDKRLKTGTRVLVDSAGKDTVGTVVSSIKIQEKYLGSLRVAMNNPYPYLKDVLGIYETKTVKVEELTKFE